MYAGLIFYLSSLPSDKIKIASSMPDYILHFIEYGIFVFLAFRFINKYWPNAKLHYLTALIIIILFGASDEWHQSFVPGRFATVSDFLADTLGAIVSAGIFLIGKRIGNMKPQ